jgi:uncharacterized protein YkwD
MPLKHLRRYALVLVAGILVAIAASTGHGPIAASAASATGDCTPDASWPANNASLSSQVLSLINQHRAQMGLSQLVISPTLSGAAIWKARHMAAYNYMAHDDPAPPVARTTADRIATCGYRSGGWGENIAYGYTTAQSVVDAWLASPGHKANIENPSYVSTGIGAAPSAANGVFWAQDFGTVNDSGSPTPTTTTTTPPPPPPPTTTTTKTTTTTPTTTTTTTTTTRTTTTTPTTTSSTPPAPTTPSSPGQPTKTAAGAVAMTVSEPGVRAVPHRLALVAHVGLATPASTSAPVFVKCSATVGGKHLRVVANVLEGQSARCAWRVPARLHGEVAHGWIKVRQAGVHIRRRFAVALR